MRENLNMVGANPERKAPQRAIEAWAKSQPGVVEALWLKVPGVHDSPVFLAWIPERFNRLFVGARLQQALRQQGPKPPELFTRPSSDLAVEVDGSLSESTVIHYHTL